MPGWLTWIEAFQLLHLSRVAGARPARPPLEAALEDLEIRHFDDDILRMGMRTLRKHFSFRTTRTINKSIFFRNVIWQLYEQIQRGDPPDFYHKRGYIRGMWYHIKSRLTDKKPLRGDHYKVMIDVLKLLVEKGLVSYADFNFRDRDEANRIVGTDNPQVVVYAEKDGFVSMMEEIARTYGVSVMTLGGSPSLMSTNFFVADLVKAGVDITKAFTCLSLVDFDPKGWDAARDFIEMLKLSGIRSFKTFKLYGRLEERLDLLRPDSFPRPIQDFRYELKPRTRGDAMTIDWASRTGGVDGRGSRRYGLESDEFHAAEIHELVAQAVTPHLGIDPELAKRRRSYRDLEKDLIDFMVYKLRHPTGEEAPA